MAFDELDNLDTASKRKPVTWDGLSDKQRAARAARWERIGLTPPKKDGVLTEAWQGAAGATLDVMRGFGSTAEELGFGSGMREYFDDVKSRNRQYDPYPGYKAASLDPTDIARTIGSGVAQSTLSTAAGMATTAATGGNVFAGGAVMTSIMFAQTYGDRVKEYREMMPDQDEGTVKGLAFASSFGESLIESVCGPEAVLNGVAKRWATGALKETTKSLVKTVGKEAAKGFITEGSEEVVQDMWNRICLRAGTENVSLPTWDEVKENFMGGAWPGLVMGGGGAVVEHVGAKKAGRADGAGISQNRPDGPNRQGDAGTEGRPCWLSRHGH